MKRRPSSTLTTSCSLGSSTLFSFLRRISSAFFDRRQLLCQPAEALSVIFLGTCAAIFSVMYQISTPGCINSELV